MRRRLVAALHGGAAGLEQLLSRILYYHGVFCGSHRAVTLLFSVLLIIAGSFPVYLAVSDQLFGTALAAPFRIAVRTALGLEDQLIGQASRRGLGHGTHADASELSANVMITRMSWNCGVKGTEGGRCLARNVSSSALGGQVASDMLLGLLTLESVIESTVDPVTKKTLSDICYQSDDLDGAASGFSCAKLSPVAYLVEPPVTGPPPSYAIRNPTIDKDNGNVHSASSFVFTYLVDGRADNAEIWWRIRAALLERGLGVQTDSTWDPPLSLPKGKVEGTAASNLPPRIEPQTTFSRLQFDFSVNHIVIVGAYLTVFLYISLSLGRVELVKSKFGLGIAAITTVFGSLTMSMGIMDVAGVTISLIQWEVLPFLIIAVGVENIFVITNGVTTTSIDLPVSERIGRGLGKVGVPITLAVFGELFLFVLGTATSIPAMQEFSLFASVAVVVDYFLQITFFTTVLSIDVRRMELSDLSHRRVAEIIRQSSAVDLVSKGSTDPKTLSKTPSESQMKAAEVNAKLAREKVAAKSFQQRTTVVRYILMIFLALFGGFLFVELLAKNAYRPAMSVFSSYDQVDLDYSHAVVDGIFESVGEAAHPFLNGYKSIEWTESVVFYGPSLPTEEVLVNPQSELSAAMESAKARAAVIGANSHPFRNRRFPKAAETTLTIVAALMLLTFAFICWTNFMHRFETNGSPAKVLSEARGWLVKRLSSDKNLAARAAQVSVPPSPKEGLILPGNGAAPELKEQRSWWEIDHSTDGNNGPTRTSQASVEVLSHPWQVGTITARLPDLTDQEHDLLGDVCLVDWTTNGIAWVRGRDRSMLYLGNATALESSEDLSAIQAAKNGSEFLALGRIDGRLWLVEVLPGCEVGVQLTSDVGTRQTGDTDPALFLEFVEDEDPEALQVLSISVAGLIALWKRVGNNLVLAGSAKTTKQTRVSSAAYNHYLGCVILGFDDGSLERYSMSRSDNGTCSFSLATSWTTSLSAIVQLEFASLSRPADSTLLVSLCSDGTLKVWNVTSRSEATHLCTLDPNTAPSEGSARPPRMAIVALDGPEPSLVIARKQSDRKTYLWRISIDRAPNKRRDSSRSSRTSTSADDLLVFKSSRVARSSTPPLAPIKTQSHHRRITAPSAPSPLVNLGLSSPPPLAISTNANGNGNGSTPAFTSSPVSEPIPEEGHETTPSPVFNLLARPTPLGSLVQSGCSALVAIKDLELIVGIRRRAVDLQPAQTTESQATSFLSFFELQPEPVPTKQPLEPIWIWEVVTLDCRSLLSIPNLHFLDSQDPEELVSIARTTYLGDDKLRGLGCSSRSPIEVETILNDESRETVRKISKLSSSSSNMDLRAAFSGTMPVLSVNTLALASDGYNRTWGICFDFGDAVKLLQFSKEENVVKVKRRRKQSQEELEEELGRILEMVEKKTGAGWRQGELVIPASSSSSSNSLSTGISRRVARRGDSVVPSESFEVGYGTDSTEESGSGSELEDCLGGGPVDKKGL